MDETHRSFIGHNGTLEVGPSGVTIKRSFAQALAAGHMTKREMHIPYQHLDRVMHERAGAHLGYLQFATKPGTPGHSQLHRSKIHFGQHHAHDFKRAKDLIDEQVMVAQEAAEKGPAKDAEPPMVNPYTGDVIPR